MKCPPPLRSEAQRLEALSAYGLDGERPLPSLDPVVQIAARMFDMPVSAVNMIGDDHVFFAASTGLDGEVDMRRDVSFCAHAIAQSEVMVVPDARLDERFHDNPLVTGAANLRFYAGAPLLSHDGHPLGALCVIDDKPHPEFSQEDARRLLELARMAADRLELRRVEMSIERAPPPPQELSSQQHREDELRRLATTDQLTGLANRAGFYRQVEQALLDGDGTAVLMIDLDGFKDVNDTLGNAVGDRILRAVAERLEASVRTVDIVARVGGDEFAVLLGAPANAESANAVARAVIAHLSEPIEVDAHEIRVTASCGVALAPQHAHEALELIGNADLALHQAKRLGRGQLFSFVMALRMEAVARRSYGMELHRAVAAGEFVLFYQPQVRLSDGTLTGAEALLRWHHPQRGLLSPAAFLPALEGGPLAATVGSWVLDEACTQAALWRRCGAEDFRIGVNLFGAQFRVGRLAAEVSSTLRRHGLPPQALELEVTENIVLDHDEVVLEALHQLREQGVDIAFDDFGTGYASLSLLKRYPLSRIKIDRSFIHGMLESRRDAAVVRAILDMARDFDLRTIAEGVETDAQCAALKQSSCDEAQGYLYGRPLPAPAFAARFGIPAPSSAAA